jgi:hypothetical protein
VLGFGVDGVGARGSVCWCTIGYRDLATLVIAIERHAVLVAQ